MDDMTYIYIVLSVALVIIEVLLKKRSIVWLLAAVVFTAVFSLFISIIAVQLVLFVTITAVSYLAYNRLLLKEWSK